MKLFGRAYLEAFIAFAILDGIWLSLIASDFYVEHLGYIMREQVIWPAAIAFYFLYIAGVVYLVSVPAALRNNWKKAGINGAVLGLVGYGTYDLTNYATLEGWPFIVLAVDLVWGAFVSSIIALGGFMGARRYIDAQRMKKAAAAAPYKDY